MISAFSRLSVVVVSSLLPRQSPIAGHPKRIWPGLNQLNDDIPTNFLWSELRTFVSFDLCPQGVIPQATSYLGVRSRPSAPCIGRTRVPLALKLLSLLIVKPMATLSTIFLHSLLIVQFPASLRTIKTGTWAKFRCREMSTCARVCV